MGTSGWSMDISGIGESLKGFVGLRGSCGGCCGHTFTGVSKPREDAEATGVASARIFSFGGGGKGQVFVRQDVVAMFCGVQSGVDTGVIMLDAGEAGAPPTAAAGNAKAGPSGAGRMPLARKLPLTGEARRLPQACLSHLKN